MRTSKLDRRTIGNYLGHRLKLRDTIVSDNYAFGEIEGAPNAVITALENKNIKVTPFDTTVKKNDVLEVFKRYRNPKQSKDSSPPLSSPTTTAGSANRSKPTPQTFTSLQTTISTSLASLPNPILQMIAQLVISPSADPAAEFRTLLLINRTINQHLKRHAKNLKRESKLRTLEERICHLTSNIRENSGRLTRFLEQEVDGAGGNGMDVAGVEEVLGIVEMLLEEVGRREAFVREVRGLFGIEEAWGDVIDTASVLENVLLDLQDALKGLECGIPKSHDVPSLRLTVMTSLDKLHLALDRWGVFWIARRNKLFNNGRKALRNSLSMLVDINSAIRMKLMEVRRSSSQNGTTTADDTIRRLLCDLKSRGSELDQLAGRNVISGHAAYVLFDKANTCAAIVERLVPGKRSTEDVRLDTESLGICGNLEFEIRELVNLILPPDEPVPGPNGAGGGTDKEDVLPQVLVDDEEEIEVLAMPERRKRGKPFKCDLFKPCRESFNNLADFKSHLLKHHCCIRRDCGAVFHSRLGLAAHVSASGTGYALVRAQDGHSEVIADEERREEILKVLKSINRYFSKLDALIPFHSFASCATLPENYFEVFNSQKPKLHMPLLQIVRETNRDVRKPLNLEYINSWALNYRHIIDNAATFGEELSVCANVLEIGWEELVRTELAPILRKVRWELVETRLRCPRGADNAPMLEAVERSVDQWVADEGSENDEAPSPVPKPSQPKLKVRPPKQERKPSIVRSVDVDRDMEVYSERCFNRDSCNTPHYESEEVKEACETSYIFITRNRGPRRPKQVKTKDLGACQCRPRNGRPYATTSCGIDSNCINRMSKIECNAKGCPAGKDCQNQSIQHRKYPRTVVFQTLDGRGFGLQAEETIPPDTLVIEYVGEVVDDEERIEREKLYGADRFYFADIGDGLFVDGTGFANHGRFINASCAPNCELQVWEVEGRPRLAIVTNSWVQAGSEVTFSYGV
ncbi:Histone-lysine N-methyltransferase NSD3, partial [Rhizophlyctis rosea]